ncbi:histidine kinase [Streptomyces scabiei]|uniref:histidine kinase n=1 Tax=Streptomyces scabiei TaxID=1930 RepID=UPI0029B4E229|nr:histidine kinase [Streptomyces scabiei]MDX3520519.1 histidine kinase [Streptomyces scabiei]
MAYRLLPVNMATSESSGSELIGLLVLLAVAVRRCTPRWAPVVVVALAVSVFSVPVLRDSDSGDFSDKTVLELALAFVCGLVLRLHDVQQERTGQLVRQEERLALARDLHDTVAHQVTAIVVQTAGRAPCHRPGHSRPADAERDAWGRRAPGSRRGEAATCPRRSTTPWRSPRR